MVDIKEHCYTSNERSTNKNHSKSKSEILWEVKKQPRVTFKQLKTLFVMVTDKPAPLASFHSFTLFSLHSTLFSLWENLMFCILFMQKFRKF